MGDDAPALDQSSLRSLLLVVPQVHSGLPQPVGLLVILPQVDYPARNPGFLEGGYDGTGPSGGIGPCFPKARIARQLGVSRGTVYNHLEREEPFPKLRKKRVSKLERFKRYIGSRLERFDLPCTVLYRELVALGYEGGLTILRDYVRPLKRELTRRVCERFETDPGRQAQIDWGECGTVVVDGERRKLYVFVMVLGCSRMLFVRFTTSSKLPVLMSCLQEAFGRIGIPREILVDNMRQAVDQHDVTTGTVRWNRSFLDFTEHHEFLPAACPPYWPRAKGKVERGVGYVKKSFLEGRSFTDLSDLNHQVDAWVDTVANVRIHGTTGARPIDRYAEEAPALSVCERAGLRYAPGGAACCGL